MAADLEEQVVQLTARERQVESQMKELQQLGTDLTVREQALVESSRLGESETAALQR